MRALRERRRKKLKTFTVTISQDEVDEVGRIEGGIYENIFSADPRAAGEGLALFISDTIACLDHLR
jgi:hypothetical protein